VILLPSTESTSIAIRIIKQIHEKNNKIKFLGEDALYNPTTLREGDNSVEGLALVVPIAPSDAYAEKAQATWGGKINWRTVASYDAAQAIIQSLEKSNDPKNLKRQDILKTLGFITITTEMSDNSWKFNHGERQSNDNERQSGPYIVQVDRGAPRPQEVPFGFKTLHCGSSSEK
jgi:ABC-type branched-subunit amino acid transport system substrate-binding protein